MFSSGSIARACLVALALLCAVSADTRRVSLIRTPEEGIQPQAAVDEKGVLHLIYFRGEAGGGNVFYVRRNPGDASFSKPIQVNSQAGSVIATGTVRGAHLALGKKGRVHVAWMGSSRAEPRGPEGATPMLYARLNIAGTAFEPQRNVMQFAVGLDGGGSLAADKSGNVFVAWHGRGDVPGEENRRVWMAVSRDGGETFEREVGANPDPTGACGCCGMRAFADESGAVYMLYRAATKRVDRDMCLLVSKDGGKSFKEERIHKWKLEACPMSTSTIASGKKGVLVSWQTEGQVYFAEENSQPVAAPGEGSSRKHPVVASNSRGETILVWTEGTKWNQGGSLAWQVFDPAGRPLAEKGQIPGIPAWSLAAVYTRPDGVFEIVY
jgi:hypothetical protein